jgi:hypothetical protein
MFTTYWALGLTLSSQTLLTLTLIDVRSVNLDSMETPTNRPDLKES